MVYLKLTKMKQKAILTIAFVLLAIPSFSQLDTYTTTGLEIIFSLADIEDNGADQSSILRFAPVINIETMLNADMSDRFGLFTGLGIRNVGYIYGHYTDPEDGANYKKKFRSYNIGIPFGVKIGNLDNLFLYGGYEVELAWLYKEKTFEGGDKIGKITGWFSSRQELFQHGFLVGVQFPYGTNLKFKYYLSGFHNQDYVNASGFKPYEGLNANVFYFSLNVLMFRNLEFYDY
jgi:hypothetical protein